MNKFLLAYKVCDAHNADNIDNSIRIKRATWQRPNCTIGIRGWRIGDHHELGDTGDLKAWNIDKESQLELKCLSLL